MKALLSFCNSPEKQDNLLLLDVFSGVSQWLKTDSFPNRGLTGLAQDEDFFYVLFQFSNCGIAIINKKTLNLFLLQNLPELRAPHSLAINKGFFYVASTGTDQVLEYQFDKKKKKINFSRVVWIPEDSPQNSDTHHINSLFFYNNDLFLSAFGRKKSERWSSAKEGYIYNVGKKRKVTENIFHPHSIFIKDGDIYYCESSSKSVKKNFETLIKLKSGYTRGLFLKGDYLFLGTSSGRKHSKSTGLVNNPADPGELVEDCRLIVYRKNGKKNRYVFFKSFDFLPKHKEIYDIIIVD